jgi:hypothetical protein
MPDAERLARGSADEDVRCGDLSGQHLGAEFGHVAKVRRIRVVVGEHCAGEGVYLGEPGGAHAERLPRKRCRLNAGADASISDVHSELI